MFDKEFEKRYSDKSLMPWLGKTGKCISIFLKESFAESGVNLTKEQFLVLTILHQHDGAIQKDLAFITERNKGSLARLVNTMEKKNYVARIPSAEDKRVNRIFLTKHGRLIFEQIQPVVEDCITLAQQGLTEEEIKMTIGVLKKIQANIRRK